MELPNLASAEEVFGLTEYDEIEEAAKSVNITAVNSSDQTNFNANSRKNKKIHVQRFFYKNEL